MKFLKALATPFVKLWNWIKQTAWVQPLLIVGCIFGVIFSIPYIASGIKNISKKEEDTMKYYKDRSQSIKGTWNGESEADKFLNDLHQVQNLWADADKNEAEIKKYTDKYGEKFFFTFVGSECDVCNSFSEGFKYLEKNTKDFQFEGEFKLHSIIVDEKIEGKELDHYKEESPYKKLFINQIYAFEDIVTSGKESYYAKNLVSITDYKNKLESILTSESTIEVPLVCLVDLSKTNTVIKNGKEERGENVITQVFYSISGDDKIAKANYLTDAWMYKGNTFGKEN